MRKFEMKTHHALALTVLTGVGMLNPAIGQGLRAETQPGAMAATPSEMKWSAQGGLALPGMEQAVLVGDPGKPGQRLRMLQVSPCPPLCSPVPTR